MERKWYIKQGLMIIAIAIILGIVIISNNKTRHTWIDYQEVKVYFADDQAEGLLPEVRHVNPNNNNDIYSLILNELIKGPHIYNATIPPNTVLLDCKLEGEILVVNFSQELQKNHWGGSAGEILTVYSIVNSLTQLPEVKAVQILIEGEVQESLVGHLDISQPLTRDEDLILSGPK